MKVKLAIEMEAEDFLTLIEDLPKPVVREFTSRIVTSPDPNIPYVEKDFMAAKKEFWKKVVEIAPAPATAAPKAVKPKKR